MRKLRHSTVEWHSLKPMEAGLRHGTVWLQMQALHVATWNCQTGWKSVQLLHVMPVIMYWPKYICDISRGKRQTKNQRAYHTLKFKKLPEYSQYYSWWGWAFLLLPLFPLLPPFLPFFFLCIFPKQLQWVCSNFTIGNLLLKVSLGPHLQL